MHYFRDVALFLIFSSKMCHIDIKTMDLKWLRRRSHSIDLTITCFSTIIIIIIDLEINQDLIWHYYYHFRSNNIFFHCVTICFCMFTRHQQKKTNSPFHYNIPYVLPNNYRKIFI